ncbi:MAG: hypothetical protein AB7E79_07210 [Rhodospirillaceae bacterium]
MGGLFDIVQYEVQVLQDGHWTVRARYTRSERDHAFTEARRIDLNESHPARVVRDVYDPQNGRSQEFTIFMSDRAKMFKPGAPPSTRGKATPRAAQRAVAERSNERRAPFAFRMTMAVGVGVVTALLITAITTWAFTERQETFASVLARSPAPGSAMTLFVTVVLFSVFTLLRGPLGISRLARTIGTYFDGLHTGPGDAVSPAREPQAPRLRREPVLRATAPVIDHDSHVLSLSRVMLVRFFTEAAPPNAAKAMEDSLGLRGLALFLAGAASELASHLEMPSATELLTHVTPTLLQDATKEALRELRAVGPADAALIATGRTGMRKYVSAADEHPSMSGALVAWHKAVRAEAPPPQAKAS